MKNKMQRKRQRKEMEIDLRNKYERENDRTKE